MSKVSIQVVSVTNQFKSQAPEPNRKENNV